MNNWKANSFHDARLALICATLWVVGLWVGGYPNEEWVGVAIIAYLSLWLSRWAFTKIIVFSLRRLRDYALSLADKLGVEVEDEDMEVSQMSDDVRAILAVFLGGVTLSIIGLSVVATALAVEWSGMTSLGTTCFVIGLATLAVGLTPLVSFLAWLLRLFGKAEARSNKLTSQVIRIERVETTLTSNPILNAAA